MSARFVMTAALALALAACSAQQIASGQQQADAAVAEAQPTVQMACWLAAAADAGFQAYAVKAKPDAGVVADEQKAMAGVTAICAAPPANLVQAVATVMAAYKAIAAATAPASAVSG